MACNGNKQIVDCDSSQVEKMYHRALIELHSCSRSKIHELTVLACKNVAHAPIIVQVIENYTKQARYDRQLPLIYLLDSIIKNMTNPYAKLFSVNIYNIYRHAFGLLTYDMDMINALWKVRRTWSPYFPEHTYAMDVLLNDFFDLMIAEEKQQIEELKKSLDRFHLENANDMESASCMSKMERQSTRSAEKSINGNDKVVTVSAYANKNESYENLDKNRKMTLGVGRQPDKISQIVKLPVIIQEEEARKTERKFNAILASKANSDVLPGKAKSKKHYGLSQPYELPHKSSALRR